MPRRVILTDAERHNFLALPTDDESLIRHWTLDGDDHRLLQTRRRDDTRLGLALQLCALRYPGRLIQRGETIPENSLAFLAEQLGVEPQVLANFARRAPTRYEQLAILRQHYGFTELTHPLRVDLLAFARGMAVALLEGQARCCSPCRRDAPPADRHPWNDCAGAAGRSGLHRSRGSIVR